MLEDHHLAVRLYGLLADSVALVAGTEKVSVARDNVVYRTGLDSEPSQRTPRYAGAAERLFQRTPGGSPQLPFLPLEDLS